MLIKAIQYTTCMVISDYYIAAAVLLWLYQRQIQAMVTAKPDSIKGLIMYVDSKQAKLFNKATLFQPLNPFVLDHKPVFLMPTKYSYISMSWLFLEMCISMSTPWRLIFTPTHFCPLWHYYATDWLVGRYLMVAKGFNSNNYLWATGT